MSRLSNGLINNYYAVNLMETSNPWSQEERDINRAMNAQDTGHWMVFQSQ